MLIHIKDSRTSWWSHELEYWPFPELECVEHTWHCVHFTVKLPGSARNKWFRNALTIHRRHKREPGLTNFIHFINNEILIVSDPIFPREAVEWYMYKKWNSRKNKDSSFATKNDGKVYIEEETTADCIYYSEDDILDRCNAFINQTLKEKIKCLAFTTNER